MKKINLVLILCTLFLNIGLYAGDVDSDTTCYALQSRNRVLTQDSIYLGVNEGSKLFVEAGADAVTDTLSGKTDVSVVEGSVRVAVGGVFAVAFTGLNIYNKGITGPYHVLTGQAAKNDFSDEAKNFYLASEKNQEEAFGYLKWIVEGEYEVDDESVLVDYFKKLVINYSENFCTINDNGEMSALSASKWRKNTLLHFGKLGLLDI